MVGRLPEKSKKGDFRWRWSLPPEAQPDQIERSAHAEEEADERQIRGIEVLIGEVASAAPEEEAREHVANDGPEGICLTIYSHGDLLLLALLNTCLITCRPNVAALRLRWQL
jgi:hypothetical protein